LLERDAESVRGFRATSDSRSFKRVGVFGRILTWMRSPVRKASSANTAGIGVDFKEPQRSMRVEFILFAAIIVAWLAIACNICVSLNWL